jgi:hypothetical protein
MTAAVWDVQIRDNFNLLKTSIDNTGTLWSGKVNASAGGMSVDGATPSTHGIAFPAATPGVTTSNLYSPDGVALWFNGTQLATGSSVSGTTGKIAKFTGSTSLGNSIITESGSVVTVSGALVAGTIHLDDALPATTNAALYITGSSGATIGTVYIGGGSGFSLLFAKRSLTVDTTLFTMADSGNFTSIGSITATGGFVGSVNTFGRSVFYSDGGNAAPVVAMGLGGALSLFTVATFNATSGAAYVGWNMRSASDALDTSKYIVSDFATKIEGHVGSFTFYTAPSGTAGNVITWTAVVKIHNSHGVSVGDTTDPGATNFRVAGTSALVGNVTASGTLTVNTAGGNVSWGTYSPSLTGVTNIGSTNTVSGLYLRVGNTVTVSGTVELTTTAAGSTLSEIDLSLPIASNFSAASDAAGTFANSADDESGEVSADATNDRLRLRWKSKQTTIRTFFFNCTYKVQ